jgi:hypothetical protein
MASARRLVDVNVLSDPTEPGPDGRVVDWLRRHESKLAVDRWSSVRSASGSCCSTRGRRRQRLERWFEEGIRGPIAATALATI